MPRKMRQHEGNPGRRLFPGSHSPATPGLPTEKDVRIHSEAIPTPVSCGRAGLVELLSAWEVIGGPLPEKMIRLHVYSPPLANTRLYQIHETSIVGYDSLAATFPRTLMIPLTAG